MPGHQPIRASVLTFALVAVAGAAVVSRPDGSLGSEMWPVGLAVALVLNTRRSRVWIPVTVVAVVAAASFVLVGRPMPYAVAAAVVTAAEALLVMRPIGATIERRFSDDTVRGLLAARTLGGTSTSLHAPSLVQNRTFLHHHLGHGPDGWHVPVGGAGAVGDALAKAATGAGAELLTGAGVSRVAAGDDHAEVTWHDSHGTHTVTARHVLSDVAPWVLRILMGDGEDPEAKPEGAQLRIAMLLERLPRLRSGVDTAVAFGGTLRVATGLDHLEQAHADAAAGRVPEPVPAEVHCHSLTDASVLGEDAPEGRHTLALVAHHLPASLFDHEREARASEAVERVLAALDEHLEEPLRSCLATDAHGEPCLQVTLPQDLEADLAMPGGHPFHGDLEWPWASNRARLETPAQRWGVQTDAEPVVVCGSGARRGGGVSGIGGHNAARAVLESR